MSDDVAPQVAQLIAQRRDAVARTAAQDLRQASMQELPDVVHRLAGKLGVFGHPTAGDEARTLMLDLREDLPVSEVQGRVDRIVSLLSAGGTIT